VGISGMGRGDEGRGGWKVAEWRGKEGGIGNKWDYRDSPLCKNLKIKNRMKINKNNSKLMFTTKSTCEYVRGYETLYSFDC